MSALAVVQKQPAEHAELQAAFGAEMAALKKRDAIRARFYAAKADQEACKRERADLVARAAKGENVPGSALRALEDRLRDAEHAAQLADEVWPIAERERQEAATARSACIGAIFESGLIPHDSAVAKLQAERDEAQRRLDQAEAARDAYRSAGITGHPTLLNQVEAAREAAGWVMQQFEIEDRRPPELKREIPAFRVWNGHETDLRSPYRYPNAGIRAVLYDPENSDYHDAHRRGLVTIKRSLKEIAA